METDGKPKREREKRKESENKALFLNNGGDKRRRHLLPVCHW